MGANVYSLFRGNRDRQIGKVLACFSCEPRKHRDRLHDLPPCIGWRGSGKLIALRYTWNDTGEIDIP